MQDDVATILAHSNDDLDAVAGQHDASAGRNNLSDDRARSIVPRQSAVDDEAMGMKRRTLRTAMVGRFARGVMSSEVRIAMQPILKDVVTIRISDDPAVASVLRQKGRMRHVRRRKAAYDGHRKAAYYGHQMIRPNNPAGPIDWYLKVMIVGQLAGKAILHPSKRQLQRPCTSMNAWPSTLTQRTIQRQRVSCPPPLAPQELVAPSWLGP
jgi:hypothetical protein